MLTLLTLGVSGARGATACPWLTQGSAAALLGGEVTSAVTATETNEGSCTFSRTRGTTSSLEVTVQKGTLAGCPESSRKLKAIGNEALLCAIAPSANESGEEVSGRVRDSFFTIVLRVRGPGKAGMSLDAQRVAVEQAAEQVAGNLF